MGVAVFLWAEVISHVTVSISGLDGFPEKSVIEISFSVSLAKVPSSSTKIFFE